MHMADALISPIVGGSMWVATTGLAGYSIKKLKNDMEDSKIPLMGVMGAFIFTAQMINFTIPATGSSGHLGGGMLLAALLGPFAGFLTIMSVLLIQALFFADGGLLSFGCNAVNMGFITCFIAYPLIYKKIMKKGYCAKRIFTASVISSIAGLQLGAFGVVLETLFSQRTELSFWNFVSLMQPIHLAIGVIEGLVTSAVLTFIWKARPELLEKVEGKAKSNKISLKKVFAILIIATVIIGGVLSWFASSYPDGLEWSVSKIIGNDEIKVDGNIYDELAKVQSNTAVLPDYNFKQNENVESNGVIDIGTSVSGLVGGLLTIILVVVTGFIISLFKKRKSNGAVKA